MRLRVFRWAALTTIASASLVVACDLDDDLFISSPGFPGSVGGSFFDAGRPVQPRSVCEDITEGMTCHAPETRECETKQHPNPTCNEVMECSTIWQAVPAERDACADTCPSAYVTKLPDGCAIPNAGTLLCEYPEGTCGCAPIRPIEPDMDGGDGGQDLDAGDVDAGDVDAGPTVYEWRCITPEAGCPRTRPAIGTECVRPMRCDYGDCLFEDGVTMRCYSGHWQAERRCFE